MKNKEQSHFYLIVECSFFCIFLGVLLLFMCLLRVFILQNKYLTESYSSQVFESLYAMHTMEKAAKYEARVRDGSENLSSPMEYDSEREIKTYQQTLFDSTM